MSTATATKKTRAARTVVAKPSNKRPAGRTARAKAPKSDVKGGHSNGYPFATKTQIGERIAKDDAFIPVCLNVLLSLQTAAEQEKGTTSSKNGKGFMSSHSVNGTALARKGKLDSEDLAKGRAIVAHYTKQLAKHFRNEARSSDPELAKRAAVFGL